MNDATWRKIVIAMRFGSQQLSEILSWPVEMLDRVDAELRAFEREFRGVKDEES